MSALPPEDEALLRGARLGLEPTRRDHARIKRRVLAQVGLGVGATTSAVSAATAAHAGTTVGVGVVATKVVCTLIVAGSLVGAGVVALRAPASSGSAIPSGGGVRTTAAPQGDIRAVRVAASNPAPSRSSPPQVEPLPAPVAPGAMLSAPPSASVVPPMATATPPPVPDKRRATSLAPASMTSSDVHAAASSTVPTSAAEGAGERNPTPAEPAPSVAVATTASSHQPPSAPGPGTVSVEAELLREADVALHAGDPAHALALLRDYAVRFPDGVLLQERDVERIDVLCALGRLAEARESAASFLRDHPSSPLAARVRGSCAAP
jgi:hypothetical protein